MRPLIMTPPRSRRRAAYSGVRRASDIKFGFNERRSASVVDIEECPVVDPRLLAIIAPLRQALFEVLAPGERADAAVNLTDSGCDVLIVTRSGLGARARDRLIGLAESADLARIARRHPTKGGIEVLASRRPARTVFSDVTVDLPPGGGHGRTLTGEAALVDVVLAAGKGARRAVDLFAGCGTLTFPLARVARRVNAFEVDREAVATVKAAINPAGLADIARIERRDLHRRPLTAGELSDVDLVVFDPPRSGAERQAVEVARSSVPRVVAISCNARTFARDARILIEGGYNLEYVQPIDQFLWSPHVELAAVFELRRD